MYYFIKNNITYTALAATEGLPNDTFSYAWAFDDNTVGTGNTLLKSWATVGDHTATVTATDNQTGGVGALVVTGNGNPAAGSIKVSDDYGVTFQER